MLRPHEPKRVRVASIRAGLTRSEVWELDNPQDAIDLGSMVSSMLTRYPDVVFVIDAPRLHATNDAQPQGVNSPVGTA